MIVLCRKTGEGAKRREFEEKKMEWIGLQKKDKKEGTSDEDDMSKMEFDEMLEFVRNTTDIETSPA